MGAPACQRVLQPRGEAAPLAGAEEAAEDERAAMRADGEPIALVRLLFEGDAQPIGLEAPGAAGAAYVDALDRQGVLGEADAFLAPGAAVIDAKGEIDERDVETEESHHRPGAAQHENGSSDDADAAEHCHHG